MQLKDNSDHRQDAAGGAMLADNSEYRSHAADIADNRELRSDASADPYAGETAGNGKEIWTPEHAADNLNRTGANWHVGNGDVAADGVLTFGFWHDLTQLEGSYYVTPDGSYAFNEAYYGGDFSAFTADQIEATEKALQSWDDLISIRFEYVADATTADLTYGNTDTGPASQAYAYLPYGEAVYGGYEAYGFVDPEKLGGDVWVNNTLSSNFSPLDYGTYGQFTLIHESGHALGLSHAGDYNASDDDDGDGVPDPITYEGDAYFFQDSHQYTVMSYFTEDVTGASWVDWQKVEFANAMTPMVHDVLSIQHMYGADMTTRLGNTTYGFNSNAGRDYFDFNLTPSPIVTIWDAGGARDKLDFSGFDTDEIINLNQGAFSSASEGATLEHLKSIGFLPDDYTQAQLEALFARYGSGPQGQMHDNIAIAYGTVIEDAVAGSGNDLLIANDVANLLYGNAGDDIVSYRDADGGVTASLFTNRGTGGDAAGDYYFQIENLEGSDHADALYGSNASQVISGLGGDDVIYGYAGDDLLIGDDGADTITAGYGNDTLYGDAGNDTLSGEWNNDSLFGGGGDDTLSGGTQDDYLDGGAGNDMLDGGAQADVLFGGDGADTLNGGLGSDHLDGGLGNDVLTGGSDTAPDYFEFSNIGDNDRITDFVHGQDKIDLTGIDADAGTVAHDSFTFIGAQAFHGTAGELRVYLVGPSAFISGDVDGDGAGDFMIQMTNHPIVTPADLILA